jgi:hypothetical protein
MALNLWADWMFEDASRRQERHGLGYEVPLGHLSKHSSFRTKFAVSTDPVRTLLSLIKLSPHPLSIKLVVLSVV